MREKDSEAKDKILESAKIEFMEKGFANASMRTIADRAGFTTGMVYSRFVDKNEMFNALVEEGATKLYDYFMNAQREFNTFNAEKQKSMMHEYVDDKMNYFIEIIYEYFDSFKLIISKSNGSIYEHYVDRLIEIESQSTDAFVLEMKKAGINVNDIEKDLNHMLSSSLFNGIFEVIDHDFQKDDAIIYVKKIQQFFNAGWDKLLGID